MLGFVGGAVGGAALSLIFALLTQVLLANQVATGLALTLFGLGLSALIGQGYVGIKPPPTGRTCRFGPLADIPVVGPILFRHDLDGLLLAPDRRRGLGGAEIHPRRA